MMQSSVTTLASLLERTFPAGLSGLIFDCDGVMVDSRDVNIGYYNLLLREVGKPPITPEQAGYVQMSTAKEALEYIFFAGGAEAVAGHCGALPVSECRIAAVGA